ncbi:MAG: DUF4160 domain-containing protein [Chloroflexi bacterium]|nr:DUF4160 domain-containing protein [Chloroflexota bacterium]
MPTISRFYGIQIRMFFDDKHGPHFHANYGEFRAQISIADGKILAGDLPPRAKKLVQEWRLLHRRELLDNWKRARRQESLVDIEGLS